jgi:long-chain acyl-CoA synthetase
VTLGAHNLARLGEAALDRQGDRDAVLFDGTWHRSAELAGRARRMSTGLRELGVAPGDRVAVVMANCPEVGLVYAAAWRAAAVVTPVVFLLPVDQLRHVLDDSGARVVVTTPEFLAAVRQAADGLPQLRAVVCVGGGDGAVDLAELETGDESPILDRADDDLAALLYTGGTTGRSRGVMLTHDNLWFCAEASYRATRIVGVTRTLVSLPLSHAFGLAVSVVGLHMEEPPATVLMRWFDAAQMLALVSEHGVQRAALVPTMIRLLLEQPHEEHHLSSMRIVVCGSAPLPVGLAQELERRMPGIEVGEGYGLTETAGVVCASRPGRRRLGSVGEPLDGYEVRIDSPDTEGVGEICVRSPGVTPGYWHSPEDTASALREGWLHTGDLGRLEDGYLYVVDRLKDLIIRNGFNIYPRDVEDALLTHADVVQCGVVGRPDPEVGEEVVAAVALRPGASVSDADLLAYAADRLGPLRRPRVVVVVDSVPLTPIGKTDRKLLRTLLAPAAAPI